jgi:hypothetical protein
MQRRRPRVLAVVSAFCLLVVALLVVAAPAAAVRWPLWTDRFVPTTEIDQWNDIAVGPGHTVYVCGTQGYTQGPGAKMTVARYGQAGGRLWKTATIPGVVTWAPPGQDSFGAALAVDTYGDAIVAGWSTSDTGGYAVVKFSGADGHVVWQKDLRMVGNAWAEDVAVDRWGAVYVTGTMVGGMSTGHAIVTIKFGRGGSERWRDVYSGPLITSEAHSLALDGSGDTYVGGLTQTPGGGTDWVTMKISPTGRHLWTRKWDGPGHGADLVRAMAVTSGAVYVAGATQVGILGRNDGVVVRYSATGRRTWTRYMRQAATDTTPMDLVLDGAGDLLLCGQRQPLDAAKPVRALLAKLSPAGRVRWLRDTPAPFNSDGTMAYYDLAPAPGGGAYLSGAVAPSATDTDVLVERRGSGGGLKWRAVYGWPDSGDDRGGRLAVDGTRAVYVTSALWGATSFYDACLQKYKP